MHVVNFIMLAGVVGLLGSTVGSTLLAWVVSRISLRGSLGKAAYSSYHAQRVEVLIPCFNEESLISKTLESIQAARLALLGSGPEVRITVGLDHCTDQTADQVTRFIYDEGVDVAVLNNPGAAGKWNMILELVRNSRADWIALVDVGAVWNQQLLVKALPFLNHNEVMSVAPSYGPAKPSVLENLNWGLERRLKAIESSAGGPVSVHGATVFYKRIFLLQALFELKGSVWLNDDVVIPLTLRTLFPNQHIVYLAETDASEPWVTDLGMKEIAGLDFTRRRRMLVGNLQWIRTLFVKAVKADVSVGLIAGRRVLRTFWAYAILFLLFGMGVHALEMAHAVSTVALVLGGIFLVTAVYRLRSAFWAGLQIPFQLYKLNSTTPGNLWN